MGLGGQYHPRGFAAWTTPEFVVISGSRSRENKSVEADFRSHGAEVLHTAHGGAVRVEIDAAGQVQVRSWCRDPWP